MPRSKANGGKSSKRKTGTAAAAVAAAAESPADTAGTDARAVRQRMGQMLRAETDAPTALAALAAAAALSSLSASTLPAASSFLRLLAVAERQLVMQGLDLGSLARLASTCRQMRAETLDKAAGKFLEQSNCSNRLYYAHRIAEPHPAHTSPLFRKHASMTLDAPYDGDAEALIHWAAPFSRVERFTAGPCDWWSEEQMLHLLSLPCMQHVRELKLSGSSLWLDRPLVQTALLGLPQLKESQLTIGRDTKLLPRAVATATQLASLEVVRWEEQFPADSLRPLRLAPNLTSLGFRFHSEESPLTPELAFCLPPTLTHLELWGVDVPRDAPRPLLKALFSRTPLLSTMYLSFVSIEATLRGLLDACVAALPSLREVEFAKMRPVDFSVGIDPDPLEPLFRRIAHRFPRVSLGIGFEEHAWDSSEQLDAVQLRYARWSSVETDSVDSEGEVGETSRSHPPNTDSGSDAEVAEIKDPLAAE